MRIRKPIPQLECRAAREGRQSIAVPLQIKAAKDDGTVEGYGSVFGVSDDWGDVVAKGAFVATLAAHKVAGTMPAMLWQHDAAEPVGVWTDMSEDDNGLRVVGKLAVETTRGRDVHALLKMGAVTGLSVGFVSKTWNYDNEKDIRTLLEVDLWEVSLVTFPANREARVTNVKAAADHIAVPKDAERILRDAGFAKADATAFVSRVMRLGEERREAAQSLAHMDMAAARLLSNLKP
jgi:HK97 family phage prohead protease